MHDCLCCSTVIYSDEPLCDCCKAAGCEKNASDYYDDCQVPTCAECDTAATFCTDGKWHDNCDDDCPGHVPSRQENMPGEDIMSRD